MVGGDGAGGGVAWGVIYLCKTGIKLALRLWEELVTNTLEHADVLHLKRQNLHTRLYHSLSQRKG